MEEQPTAIPEQPKKQRVLTPEQLEHRRKVSREYRKKYYAEHKNDPIFKSKQRAWFKSWLERNRAHFNEISRERNRLRAAALRQKWKTEGTCTHCGQPRIEGRLFCQKCIDIVARSRAKYRKQKPELTQTQPIQPAQ
jgi:hypothetical protein